MSRARMRARARAEAEAEGNQSIPFGIGMAPPPENESSVKTIVPEPTEQLNMPGFYSNQIKSWVDNNVDDKTKATLAGGLVAAPFTAGTSLIPSALAIGGGATVGGMAQQKFGEGVDPEFKQVASDMLWNTAGEAVPAGLVKTFGKFLKSTGIADSLVLKAAGVGHNAEKFVKEAVLKVGRKFAVSGKGVQKTDDFVAGMSKEVDDLLEQMTKDGVSIDGEDVLARASELRDKQIGRSMGGNAERESMDKAVQEVRGEWGGAEGRVIKNENPNMILDSGGRVRDYEKVTNIPQQPANSMSPVVAQEVKRDTQKVLSGAYQKLQKQGGNLTRAEANKAALTKAVKNSIEEADTTGKVLSTNKEISDYLIWRDHAASRLAVQGTNVGVPNSVYMPAIAETVFKGKLGLATALGGTRWVAGNPKIQSSMGRAAGWLQNASLPKGTGLSLEEYIGVKDAEQKKRKKK